MAYKRASRPPPPAPPPLEGESMAAFTERAYLSYSMYVVLDRALPQLADGLKPVQRRIVYAMNDLGLSANAKYKKSARTVGDVLGKFHPHSDTACYEAMVLMAQSFSYRYPLVDGQGNWGAPDDPKSFAAMRYTEARLTRYAQVLLAELGQGTVNWTPNFDATLNEPQVLPARLPNILLNGGAGIAVGMATDIPPHNIREVVNACVRLLEHPRTTVAELCEHIHGPDFPTEAIIITPPAEIRAIYETGNGSLRQRAVWTCEAGELVITALPYQVSGARVLAQIAAQMNAKKLPLVADLRDESDHENPTRLVIVPRSGRIDSDELMRHLFATTDLERSYRVNMNAIGLNRRPRVYNLRDLLGEWLGFRTETVRRRLAFRLERVLQRLERLAGLLIAYLNLDEVIRIIRTEDQPGPVLMARFSLHETQAEAILELKLRHLAKLEEMKIRTEQDKLAAERNQLQKTLGSPSRLRRMVRDELLADAQTHGDPRRSPIEPHAAARALAEIELVPSEPCTVVLSEKGWVRAAKGHDIDPATLSYRAGDRFLVAARGRTNDTLVLLDSTGRAYSLAAHSLPSARSLGEPLSSGLKPPAGATFPTLMLGASDECYLLSTSAGYGFRVQLGELAGKNKAGKAVLKVATGGRVLTARRVFEAEDDRVAVVTSAGQLLIFPVAELPALARGKGVKLLNVPTARFRAGEEDVVDVAVARAGETLVLYCGKRHLQLKPADFEAYAGERAQRGKLLPRGFRQVQRIEVQR